MTPRATKPALPATSERATLGDCLASEVVELADETPEGGTMHGRTLPAGARVMVSWQAGDQTMVYVWERTAWGMLTNVAASARVGRVVVSKVPPPAAPDVRAETDPLRRAAPAADDELPLFGRRR